MPGVRRGGEEQAYSEAVESVSGLSGTDSPVQHSLSVRTHGRVRMDPGMSQYGRDPTTAEALRRSQQRRAAVALARVDVCASAE